MEIHMKIRSIEYIIETDDLTVWFDGSNEPFSEREFTEGSDTRIMLEELHERVRNLFILS